MTITIIDREGDELITIDRSSRTFARHLERGDIIATGEPLVFRLIREHALIPVNPIAARRRHVRDNRQ